MNTYQTDESEAEILIVDDKIENLRFLSEIIKQKGYIVRQMRDGDMVMPSVLSAPPDLILLDIMMPGTDGYEVCRQLKAEEQTCKIPIIFISALNETVDKTKAFSSGGVDYITKPFQEEEVLARVATHLALRKAQQRVEVQNRQLQQKIAECKQAEKKLKDSEKKNSSFLESSPVCTKMVDLDFNLQYMSTAGVKMLKIKDITQFYGKPYPLYFFPKSFQNSMTKGLKKVKETGEIIEIEGSTVDTHGKEKWLYSTLVPVNDDDGQIDYIIVVSADITERKKMEEKLKKSEELLNQTGDMAKVGGWQLDLETQRVIWTQTTGRIHELPDGFVPALDEAINFYHPDDREAVAEFVNQAIEAGKSYDFEARLITANGKQRWVRAIGQPIMKANKCVRLSGAFHDITERKKMETQLKQSQKMESIGTLAGGIAHDFNNIMAIILGNTELALDDIPKWNSAHSSLEEIKTASLRAKNIVKQLLSFSRKTDQKLQPIQIASVITDALKFLRSTIPTTINIHRDIIATEEMILADPNQINQIIMNLCINASHAMEQTGGDLTIAVETVVLDDNSAIDYPGLKSGNHVKIMISDTGPGIDPEIINQIFDPYFTTKEIGKGSGMGLAVVHGIVKSHSGAIVVDSSQGKGAEFIILFPLVTEKSMVEDQATQDIPGGDETILFVDDEISIVKMVKRMFERLGYKVETATTPQEALNRFSLNPDHFDLVITDMTMPQMTGVKLSEKLMDIRKDIPIVVCTGYSNLVDEEKAKELGLAAYVMKPIDMQETAQTIRKVLDKK